MAATLLFAVMHAVKRRSPKEMPAHHRWILVTLADAANDTGHAWLSARSIAETTGLCERTVRSCLDELEAAKWIEGERRDANGRPLSTRYHVRAEGDAVARERAGRHVANHAPGAPSDPAPGAPMHGAHDAPGAGHAAPGAPSDPAPGARDPARGAVDPPKDPPREDPPKDPPRARAREGVGEEAPGSEPAHDPLALAAAAALTCVCAADADVAAAIGHATRRAETLAAAAARAGQDADELQRAIARYAAEGLEIALDLGPVHGARRAAPSWAGLLRWVARPPTRASPGRPSPTLQPPARPGEHRWNTPSEIL